MNKHYDEFILTLSYLKPGKGSWPRPRVEGFYLTAGWGNEGEADWPIDHALLTNEKFGELIGHTERIMELPVGKLRVREMLTEKTEADAKRLKALEARKGQIEAEIDLLKNEAIHA